MRFLQFYSTNALWGSKSKHKGGMEKMCTHSHILEMHLDDNETTDSNIGNNESF